MSSGSSLDRESFQQLLANVFALQKSQIDSQSLRAIVEVQRLIGKGELDVDGAMHLIVDCARNLANATGVAIGVLQGDQLVYRAGSGTAATYIGRRRMVALTIPANAQARCEILRVDNTETDSRIEAAICRQFGARSLVILPIYRARAVAGVLEVFFSEAHTFQDREVHTYRLMAGLVEEVIFRDVQVVQKRAQAAQAAAVPYAIKQVPSQTKKYDRDDKSSSGPAGKPWIGQVGGAAAPVAEELPELRPPAETATTIYHPAKRASVEKLRWNVVTAAVVIALGVAGWIVYDHRSASPVDGSARRRSDADWQQPVSAPAKLLSANPLSTAQTAGGGRGEMNAATSAFKRVQVGQNEVDYVAEDVTIRYFTPKPALTPIQTWNKQVPIGDDVTVRYFAYKPAGVSPRQPVSAAVPSGLR